MAVLSSDGYLGIIKQALQGTALAPTKFFRLSGPESIEMQQETYQERSLNAGREIDKIYKTINSHDGGFPVLARPDDAGLLMAFLLGADAIVTGVTHNHTITRAATIPWATIERKLTSAERIKDCKINQITIAGSAGQPITMNVSFLGTDATIESAASASYETDEAFKFWEGVFTIDGSADTTVSSFNIAITNGLEGILTTGFVRNDILEANFNIDIEYVLKFVDDVLYKKYLYAASTATVNTLFDGAFIADFSRGSAGTAREFKITLPALKTLTAVKHLDPGNKAVFLTVTAKAIKSASPIITVLAKNATATAYI